MSNNAHDAYLESRVLSADPLELVRMLYQAAIAAVSEARRSLAAGHIAERSQSISKACGILIELTGALDRERGGTLSDRLAALYEYMLHQLMQANIHQNDAPLAEVGGLLSTLADAWEATRTQAVAARAPSPAAAARPAPEAAPAPALEAVPAPSSQWSLPPEPASGSYAAHAWSF